MGLKEYSTVINGQATTLQLSDEDAKLQGFTKKDLVSSQSVEVTEAQRAAAKESAAHAEAEAKKEAEKLTAKKASPAPPANKAGKAPSDKQAAAAAGAFGARNQPPASTDSAGSDGDGMGASEGAQA